MIDAGLAYPNRRETKPSVVVRVYFQDMPMGFYQARNITHEGLLLEHGPIDFPEGSDITLEFFDRARQARFGLKASVLDKDDDGMRLLFDYTAEQGRPYGHREVE